MTESDLHDVRACLNGDEEAYERLVCRHQAMVAAQMWRLCRNRAVCEELVQEVFVEAYFSLASYRGDAPFLYWLRKISARVGYRYCKQAARQRAHVAIANGVSPDAGQREVADPTQAAGIVQALLARLDPKERMVLSLLHLEGRSVQEIAGLLGWNRAMVKMRAYRARRKLRKIIEAEDLMEKLAWTP